MAAAWFVIFHYPVNPISDRFLGEVIHHLKRPLSLYTLFTELYATVEKHEGMQSCSEQQRRRQCFTQKINARIRTRQIHVSRIRSEMQHTDRGKERQRQQEIQRERVKAPFQVLHGECEWR